MRRLFTLLLALLFICATANAESIWVTCEGPGYDTPDEAARAYVEAMNVGDMNTMVATFAVETYVDHRTQSMIATMLGLEVLSNGLVVGDALAGFLG